MTLLKRLSCCDVEKSWSKAYDAPWLAVFKRELHSLPRGGNDVQVDSFAHFLNWSKGQGLYRALGRDHQINIELRERNRERFK